MSTSKCQHKGLGKASISNLNSILDEAEETFDISRNKILEQMICFLYYSTDFKGAKYDGRVYHGRVYYGDGSSYDDDEPDREVDGPIEFLYKFNRDCDEYKDWIHDICEEEDSEENIKFKSSKFIDYLKSLENKMDNILYRGLIIMKNSMGRNDDFRGSDCCEIELPFSDNITLNNPTLNQFIQGLYWLKSHKFDKWYEMYTGCNIHDESTHLSFDDGVTASKQNNIIVELAFDHGS
jgi:hypothetical protein